MSDRGIEMYSPERMFSMRIAINYCAAGHSAGENQQAAIAGKAEVGTVYDSANGKPVIIRTPASASVVADAVPPANTTS